MKRAFATLALALLGASTARAGVPEWLARAAAVPTPPWAGGYHAVVLLDSAAVEVPASGRTVWHSFGVRRVLDTQGARLVLTTESYERSSGAVRLLRGWVIAAGGRVKALGDEHVSEAAAHGEGELYSDRRHRVLLADAVAPGDVVAWESVSETDPFLAEWSWSFADASEPVVCSSLRLALPPGVEPVAHWAGPDSVSAQHDAAAWTWTRRGVLPPPREPLAPPSASGRAALLSVTTRAGGAATAALGHSFASWAEVGAYFDALDTGPGAVTPEIAAAATRLTAAAHTPWERLCALARRVQEMNYVAIALDEGHGGGYTPHPAADVLRNGYGDCKDKATLFHALAHAAGFEVEMVSAWSGDPTHVDPGLPLANVFNHAFVVIHLPAGLSAPLAFDEPGIGTLLPFDPTDPVTPLGDLPEYEQGASVLVESGRDSRLVTLPVAPPAARATRLAFRGTLTADGELAGRLAGTLTGATAAGVEALRQRADAAQLREGLLRLLSTPATAVAAESVAVTPLDAADQVRLGAVLRQSGAARKASGGLLVFRPAVACIAELPELPDSVRHLPVLLPLVAEDDSFAIALPAGFAADDLPAPVGLHADFGDLAASWSVAAGTLRMHYALTTRRTLLPPERYAEARRFCAVARAALYAPVVLAPR